MLENGSFDVRASLFISLLSFWRTWENPVLKQENVSREDIL